MFRHSSQKNFSGKLKLLCGTCLRPGKYDVVHIHAEGPAAMCWLPKLFGKRVIVTVHGLDWQREKWSKGLGSNISVLASIACQVC